MKEKRCFSFMATASGLPWPTNSFRFWGRMRAARGGWAMCPFYTRPSRAGMKPPKAIYLPHMAEEIEQIDVLDTAGQPTGQTKSIDDIHRDEDWHAGAHVWVVNARGELLFQRRVADGRLWEDI